MFRSVSLAVLLSAISAAAQAQAIQCGEPYTVQRGDTLQRIAERAYGPGASFRQLIEPNRDRFAGGNPSRIEIGDVLSIPCIGEAAASEPAAEPTPDAVVEAPAAVPQQPPLDVPPVGMLRPAPAARATLAPSAETAVETTASVDVPTQETPEPEPVAEAADPTESPDPASPVLLMGGGPRGGIDLAVFRAAMARAGHEMPETVAAPAAADPVTLLRAAGSPAIALAWPRPDCDAVDAGSAAAGQCDDLAWSAPLDEDVLIVLTRTGSAPEADAACRTPATSLIALGRDAGAPILRPLGDCLDDLAEGRVGTAYVMGSEGAEPPAGTVEAFARGRLVTLHAVALIDDDTAAGLLAALDEGLAALRDAGEWRTLLAEALAP